MVSPLNEIVSLTTQLLTGGRLSPESVLTLQVVSHLKSALNSGSIKDPAQDIRVIQSVREVQNKSLHCTLQLSCHQWWSFILLFKPSQPNFQDRNFLVRPSLVLKLGIGWSVSWMCTWVKLFFRLPKPGSDPRQQLTTNFTGFDTCNIHLQLLT